MADCIFCKIVKKEIPSQTVFENDQMIIFKDINPVAPIHLLAIPKEHVSNVCDPKLLNQELLSAIFKGIQEVANNLNLRDKGFRVVANYGQDAGEAVPHLHFHVIAGRKLSWPPG